MVRNEEKYSQAVQFRKRGFTLEEIGKICEVSKSTVSKWLKNKAFSTDVTKINQQRARQENGKRLKLVQKSRTLERTKRYQEAERSAVTEYKHYKNNSLFIAGLILYQCNGDLADARTIRFSSVQNPPHKIFISFCREFLGVQIKDTRFQLVLSSNHSEEACMRKWKRITGLPYSQFHKTQYLQTKPKKKPLHSGVGSTIIGNTVLKRKLLVWLKLVQKDLTK